MSGRVSVASLVDAVQNGDDAAQREAVNELRDRAEAGDTASQKALVALGQAEQELEVQVGLTLPGIADNLLDLLGRACLDLDEIAREPGGLHAVGAVEIGNLAALASAFRDVDAVLARVRADQPSPLAPTLEAFLTAAWDESQKAGVAIDVADQVVGKLRLRLAANG